MKREKKTERRYQNTISTMLFSALVVSTGGCADQYEESYADPGMDADSDAGVEVGQIDNAITMQVTGDPKQPQSAGMGFTSNTQEFRNYCFANRSIYPSVPGEGSGGFTKMTSNSSIEQSLGISASAKGSYGLFSGSLSAKFTRDTRSTAQSISTVYTNRSHIDTIGLDKTRAFGPISTMTPGSAQWLLNCGDFYLKDIQRGGEIFVLSKMDFATESEKSAFQASAAATYATASADVQASKSSKSFAGRATIHLEAYQRGGEVQRLGTAFSGTTGGTEALAAINCSFDNLQACTDFLSGAMKYASGGGVNDFPANVKRAPAHLGYTLERWIDLAGFSGSTSSTLPSTVTTARNSLYTRLKSELEVRSRIDALTKSNYFGGSSTFVTTVQKADTQSTKNADAITAAAAKCFDSLSPTPTSAQITACTNAVALSGTGSLTAAGYVSIPLSSLATPLKTYSARGRTDYYGEITPGVGLYGAWTAWKMCPAKTWAVGYRMRVESPVGDRDDTALNGVELDCQPLVRAAASPLLIDAGLYGTWQGFSRCQDGPMNGMNLRFESSQGGSDDAGATNLKGSCVSGETIQAPGGLDQWGSFLGATYCPPGTAVCGAHVRTEGSQGGGDDTTLNGIELACCGY